MSIGTKIQAALKARGVSQKELAERLGVTHVQIGKYIRGQVTPKPDQLYKIADALDISPLFFGLLPEKITRDGDLAGYLITGIRANLLIFPPPVSAATAAEQSVWRLCDPDVMLRIHTWYQEPSLRNELAALRSTRLLK